MTENLNGVPQFDFSELSWKDSKDMSRVQALIRNANESGNVEDMDKGFAGMESMLAKVLLYIPREWLVKSAPENLEWSDPQSLDYVRSNRMTDLIQAMIAAQAPDATTKN